jgi:hypothetical protein
VVGASTVRSAAHRFSYVCRDIAHAESGTRNATELASVSSIQMWPPCASTRPRAMASPSPPTLPALRVRLGSARVKRSNAVSRNSAGNPGPWSLTRTVAAPSEVISMRTSLPAGAWRIPLSIRLRMTRANATGLATSCTGSAQTRRSERLDRCVRELDEVDRQSFEVEVVCVEL